jgi:hypothetical protein
MFVIEDETHSEPGLEFASRELAMEELKRLAKLPWNEPPNQAPCSSWETCGRRYCLVEYDTNGAQWRQLSFVPMLELSRYGAQWLG